MSLHAPNPAGMKDAMLKAYQGAQIDPKTVTYIEAHGIASPLADAIEIEALKSGCSQLGGTSTGSTGGSAMLYQQLKAEHRTR